MMMGLSQISQSLLSGKYNSRAKIIFIFSLMTLAQTMKMDFLNFCFQYYGGSNDELPTKLFLDVQDENHQIISDAFKKSFNAEIKVVIKPQKKWNRLLDLNKEQAYQALRVCVG